MIEKYTNRPALRVIFEPVTERKYVRSMSLIDPMDEHFQIRLEGDTLHVPMLPLDIPTIFNRFTHKIVTPFSEKKYTFSNGYKNMVTAVETYRMGHLVKVERSFGVYIQNENNEQYTKPVTIFMQSIYLRYFFGKDERRWKIVFDGTESEDDQAAAKERLQRWLEDEEMLDGLLKTPEIDAINEAFETVSERHFVTPEGKRFADTLLSCRKAVDAVERYFGTLHAFELIAPVHHAHIAREIEKCRNCERLATLFMSENPDYYTPLSDLSISDHFTQQLHIAGNRRMDALREQLHSLIQARGYWVDPAAGEIYENPGEHIALKLPASEHRNYESKMLLKQTLLRFAAKNAKHYISLSDVNFINALNKAKNGQK